MGNVFTPSDYQIVRTSMNELPTIQFKVVFLRFWGKLTLLEISKRLRLNLTAVERHLVMAQRTLRESCLKYPGFSKNAFQLQAA